MKSYSMVGFSHIPVLLGVEYWRNMNLAADSASQAGRRKMVAREVVGCDSLREPSYEVMNHQRRLC